MKKITLKDMKKKNIQLVLQCIAKENELSRTELAEITGLSISTISTLTSELLKEGILCEIGEAASTGGRKRIQMAFSGKYGLIALFHIKSDGIHLKTFDMTVKEISNVMLSGKPLYGNDLLQVMTEALSNLVLKEEEGCRKLVGIGLVLQDNMNIDDFVVTYSTGVSSAPITLEAAVKTQFRVPVVIDYSAGYTVTSLEKGQGLRQAENKMFIRIGKTVLARVVVEGKALEINGEKYIDLSPLLLQQKEKPISLYDKGSYEANEAIRDSAALKKIDIYSKHGIKQFVQALKPICVFFSIRSIYFSGEGLKHRNYLDALFKIFKQEKGFMTLPRLEYEEKSEPETYYQVALRLRNQKLNIS